MKVSTLFSLSLAEKRTFFGMMYIFSSDTLIIYTAVKIFLFSFLVVAQVLAVNATSKLVASIPP